ncbi:MAG: TrkH family potassium uptake protein [Candidatus Mcinerneyibacterium aminivorans]|uniref:TrkH family potassium uptake protein n=1 Tax=Candidatus Mcinerneyibacterium aminivorans TaxID=2703815 RepID=A0A5D0MIU9_9BACT|nr:MAG: TrkH family potassium uptake protein [Candidatus Mcinerneyibacterium aminivorans]
MKHRLKSISGIFHILSYLTLLFSFILIVPMIFALFFDGIEIFYSFVYTFLSSLVLGGILFFFTQKKELNLSQGMIVCALGWLFFSFIGAIPYILGINQSFVNSYFEAMSGFTTTGITMFTGLNSMPKSILLWRSLTQWLGGLGIITFFIGISSKIYGAHRLFGAESHKAETDRPTPGLINTVKILWLIYTFFTLLIIFLLHLNDVSLFNSINHGLTALSTGGFSTFDQSIAYFSINNYANSGAIEYIIILGMLLGGISFLLHYFFLRGEIKKVIQNIEFRYFIGILLLFFTLILGERIYSENIFSNVAIFSKEFWLILEKNIRTVLFQVVAILTTTGFGTKDIGNPYFGAVAKQIFLVAMFIGGCVGSTAGGFKVLRIAILNKIAKLKIFKMYAPRRALDTLYFEGKKIENEEINRITTIFYTWLVLILIGGLSTAFLSNHGALASASGMFSALGNIGPCYMSVNEMIVLHPVVKIVYIIGMLAGRLEILPVLLLFTKKAWY